MFQSSPCACSGMPNRGSGGGGGRGLLTLVYNIFHKDLRERKQKHLKKTLYSLIEKELRKANINCTFSMLKGLSVGI